MKTLKGIFTLLLLLSIATSLFACTKKQKDIVHSEADILAAAEERITESVLWNRIFFIEGLPVLEGGRASGVYREVDPAYLEALGMSSVSDIIDYGKTVYSTSMMTLFEETLFSSIKNEIGGVSTSAVCFDYTEKIDGQDRFLCVMVDPEQSPRFGASELEYLYDTMKVEYNLNGRAIVSLSVKKVGSDETRLIRVNLLLENEVWFLDGYTHQVFLTAQP